MALNCKINSSVSKDCQIQPGGVKKIAVINLADITISDAEGEGKGVLVKSEITLAKGAKFYVWDTATETTTATNAVTQGANVDQKFFTQTVTGTIVGFPEQLLGDELNNIVLSDTVIAVKENSGKTFVYGYDNGLKCSQFDYASGAAASDLRGVTFTFTGAQYQSPYVLDDSFTFDELVEMVGE